MFVNTQSHLSKQGVPLAIYQNNYAHFGVLQIFFFFFILGQLKKYVHKDYHLIKNTKSSASKIALPSNNKTNDSLSNSKNNDATDNTIIKLVLQRQLTILVYLVIVFCYGKTKSFSRWNKNFLSPITFRLKTEN